MKQSQSRVMKHVHSWQRIKRFAINGLINVHQIGTKFHERRVSSFHFLVLIINFKFLHKKNKSNRSNNHTERRTQLYVISKRTMTRN